ncbi:hypothetical protein Tco_0412161 [Tanacetum coccineum]
MRIVLRYAKKMKLVEQPMAPALDPETADPCTIDKYYESINIEQEVACLMLLSMSPDLQRTLEKFNSYDMLKELKTMFEEQAKQELFETVKAFHACKEEDGQSLHEKGIPKKAETLAVLAIREGRIQKDEKKLQREKGKDKGKNKLAYAPKPKIPPSPKRDNLAKDSIYHHCKEVGHWRRNYPSYQAELRKKKNASEASTLGYALEFAARILNMILTKKVDRTSYEIWHGKALKLSYLRVWGCEAYVKRDTPDKLDSRSINCIFVFFDNNLILQEASGSHRLLEMSGGDLGLELIQEDDTQTSKNTSKRHDEIEPNEDHELGYFNEPLNYKAALSDTKFKKWLDAMNTEMQFMRDNQQASRSWNKRFDEEIKKIGFTQTLDEPCVYLKASGYLGEAAYILEIKIIRDRSKRLISLSQSAYFDKILKKFKMENSKCSSTSMQEKPDYRKSQGAQTPSEVKRVRSLCFGYRIYYVCDMVLVYGAKPESGLKVTCYADAGFQTNKDDTKSQPGYVFVLNGGAMDWKSAKQSTTAMSFTKAEYIDAAEASMEAVWMRKTIDGLGDVMPSNQRPMEMLCDNAPAIEISNDPRITRGARHYQKKYYYIREVI